MRYFLLTVASLALACNTSSPVRPPAYDCDAGCSGLGTNVSGGGGGGGGGTDAGLTDATDFDAGAIVSVNGSVAVFTRFPAAASTASAADGGAAGWTVTPVALDEPVTMTDANGQFALDNVPTETFAGLGGRYYGLRARPVGMDLGSYQLFAVGGGAANLQGISYANLLASIAGAMVTPDIARGHVIVFFVDSGGPTARPTPGVTVDSFRDSVATLYDDELGTLSASLTATGALGVVAVLNVAATTAEARDGHPFSFRITRAGRSASVSTLVFPQTVTWLALLAP